MHESTTPISRIRDIRGKFVNIRDCMEGKYLYCIVKQPFLRGLKSKGIEEKKVYTINYGKFCLVVSDAEKKEYLPTRENLLAHQKVIEEILKKFTLLPISFGTVAEDSQQVKKILKSNAGQISENFKKIEGKIELGLKVFWQDIPAIFEEIVKENREIQIARAQGSVGRGVMLRMGEMVAKSLEGKKNREAAFILQPLAKIAQEVKEGELLRDDMILNANFLVKREREKDFDKVIDELDKKYGQRLRFKYIGPIPPSNFINLHLTL